MGRAQVWDMHALLKQGMDSGEVAPLPWTVYGRDQCQDAFRFLASGARPAALCLHPHDPQVKLKIHTIGKSLQCSPSAAIMPMQGYPHLHSSRPCPAPGTAPRGRRRTRGLDPTLART